MVTLTENGVTSTYDDMLDAAGATGDLKSRLRQEMEETAVRSRLQSLIDHEHRMNSLAIASIMPGVSLPGTKARTVRRLGGVTDKQLIPLGGTGPMASWVQTPFTFSRVKSTGRTNRMYTVFGRNPDPESIARVFGLRWSSPFARPFVPGYKSYSSYREGYDAK